jgi:hypothetical protein
VAAIGELIRLAGLDGVEGARTAALRRHVAAGLEYPALLTAPELLVLDDRSAP